MADEETRALAIKTAAGLSHGILKSLNIEGENRDELVVIGTEIDAVELVNQLRRQFGFRFYFTPRGLFRRRAGDVRLITISKLEEKEDDKKDDKASTPMWCLGGRAILYRLLQIPEADNIIPTFSSEAKLI